MSFTDEELQWISFYDRMQQGQIPYSSDLYYVDKESSTSQDGSGEIKFVTPTQAQVEQARMQIKRKILDTPRHRAVKRRRKRTTKPTKSQKGGKKAKPQSKKSQKGGSKRKTNCAKKHLKKKRT